MFKLDLMKLPELVSVSKTEGGRFYTTPEGKVYPSVTTVLGATKDQTHLLEWKKRLGEAKANQESKRTANRGTALHSICERFILNQEIDLRKEMPVPAQLFSQIRPVLSENIGTVFALENSLYSHYLKVAGRVDLVAEYDGKLSIIDFKSSNKNKNKDWIEDYFIQTAMYSIMFEEMTKIPVPRLVIIIGVEESIKCSVFVEKRDTWTSRALGRINKYYRENLNEET
jgi:genome maintenance exonuclease 1